MDKITETYIKLMNLKNYIDNAPDVEVRRKNIDHVVNVLLRIIEEEENE